MIYPPIDCQWEWLIPALIEAGGYGVSAATSGGGQQEVAPHDLMTIQQQRIGPQTEAEALMALLQQRLAEQGMGTAMAGGTGGISMGGLAGGQFGGMNLQQLMQGDISGTQDERLRGIAFGGIEEAGRRAMDVSMGRYQKMGMPMSSMQQGMYGSLMRDPMEQAARHYGQLQQQELGRMGGLYQQEGARQQGLYGMGMQNMMAMQAAPALQRLLQIRMAESAAGGFERLSEEGGLKGWEETMRGPKQLGGEGAGTYPHWGMQPGQIPPGAGTLWDQGYDLPQQPIPWMPYNLG